MGCVSSAYLNEEEGTIISHHIVSLTSTTYGLLTSSSLSPSPPPETINSWELMAGIEDFQMRVPPGTTDSSLVLYTTTLRTIRKTFEGCNAVRSALEGLGVCIRERDVSMDLGYRQELAQLMRGTGEGPTVPRLFVKGRYIGGAEEVMKMHEEGVLAEIVEGVERKRGGVCDGCGGVRFMNCFRCFGSRKVAVGLGEKGKVVRCGDCNENGLVVCPICC